MLFLLIAKVNFLIIKQLKWLLFWSCLSSILIAESGLSDELRDFSASFTYIYTCMHTRGLHEQGFSGPAPARPDK